MLEMRDLSLRYGKRPVLHDVALRLTPGERLGLIGPSGAGKSSLLRLAAGLLRPTSGSLRNSFAHSVLMFQEARLLPWRDVLDNVALPLRAAGHGATQARAVATHWLHRVGLEAVLAAWPRELSGGMAQRVALARALALSPDLLLLDEPFSALDPALRRQLATCCRTELSRSGAALLCISHDPAELLGLVDRCLLVHQGRVTEIDLHPPPPSDGSGRPASHNSHQANAEYLHRLLLDAASQACP